MKNTFLTLFLLTTPVTAQSLQCGGTPDVYAELTEKYGENRQLWAQNGPSQIVEFWAGDKGWTILMTTDNGQSCMVGEGVDWGIAPSEEKPQL